MQPSEPLQAPLAVAGHSLCATIREKRECTTGNQFFRLILPTDDFVERLVDVDYVRQMAILALTEEDGEEVLGMGSYILNEDDGTAEVYFALRDDCQNQGIGRELLIYLTAVARKRGWVGFTAEVRVDNRRMLYLSRSFEGHEFTIRIRMESGIFYLDMEFV
jgi:GNAT superfamily N-acetyltransferase